MRRKRILLGVGANLVDQGVIVLIQLVSLPLLLQFWGAEQFGVWSMLTVLPAVFALGDLGFGVTAEARMTMAIARGDVDDAALTLRATLQVVATAIAILYASVTLVNVVFGSAIATWSPLLAGQHPTLRLYSLTTYSCGVLLAGVSQAIFRSTQRFAQGKLLATFGNALEAAFLLIAASQSETLAVASTAWAGGRLIGVTLQWLVAVRALPELFIGWWKPAPGRVRELIAPSLAALSLPISRAVLQQGTVAALGGIAGPAVVPAFVAARTLSRIGTQGSLLLTVALMPEFASAVAQENRKLVTRMFLVVLATALAISVPYSLVLGLVGPWLITLWTHGQLSVPPALMVAMALAALFGGIWNPISNLIIAINQQIAFAFAYGILAIAGLVLTTYAASELGEIAPALGMAATDLLMVGVVLIFALRNWTQGQSVRPLISDILQVGLGELKQMMRMLARWRA